MVLIGYYGWRARSQAYSLSQRSSINFFFIRSIGLFDFSFFNLQFLVCACSQHAFASFPMAKMHAGRILHRYGAYRYRCVVCLQILIPPIAAQLAAAKVHF